MKSIKYSLISLALFAVTSCFAMEQEERKFEIDLRQDTSEPVKVTVVYYEGGKEKSISKVLAKDEKWLFTIKPSGWPLWIYAVQVNNPNVLDSKTIKDEHEMLRYVSHLQYPGGPAGEKPPVLIRFNIKERKLSIESARRD